MLAKVVRIVQDVVERVVVICAVVLVSRTIVVLGKLAGVVVFANAVVVTEVDAIGQAFQRQLNLTIDIGKEGVCTIIVVNQRVMIGILACVKCRIMVHVTIFVIWFCQRAAFYEEWQVW